MSQESTTDKMEVEDPRAFTPPKDATVVGAQAAGKQDSTEPDRSLSSNHHKSSSIIAEVAKPQDGYASLPSSSATAPPSTKLDTTAEADQTSNAQVAEHDRFIAQLDKRIIELQVAMDAESDLRANSKYLVVDFCRILMKLASELPSGPHQSAEYIMQQILSEDGGVLTDLGCADFSRRIEIFFAKIVKKRFGVYKPELSSAILEFAENRCLLSGQTEVHLAHDPTGAKYDYSLYQSLQIISLVPELNGTYRRSEFWKFAAGIMGDESLVHFGQGFAHDYQPNEFLVLHTPIASEFSKFKIAIGTEISSTGQGQFRQVERNLHDDLFLPPDEILDPKKLPRFVDQSQISKYDQSLLNLHLFLYRLINETQLGSLWIQNRNWNHDEKFPPFNKDGQNIEEVLSAKEAREEELGEILEAKILDKHVKARDATREWAVLYRQELIEKGYTEVVAMLDQPRMMLPSPQPALYFDSDSYEDDESDTSDDY